MGIPTVAVYSEADKDALPRPAGRRGRLHRPGAAAQSRTCDIDKIIAACKQTGAEAVHPGYGFLSENAVLRGGWRRQGIVFIGPHAESIAAMGDKIASKKLARERRRQHDPRLTTTRSRRPTQAVAIARARSAIR